MAIRLTLKPKRLTLIHVQAIMWPLFAIGSWASVKKEAKSLKK
jgi:hypothetical protein